MLLLEVRYKFDCGVLLLKLTSPGWLIVSAQSKMRVLAPISARTAVVENKVSKS